VHIDLLLTVVTIDDTLIDFELKKLYDDPDSGFFH